MAFVKHGPDLPSVGIYGSPKPRDEHPCWTCEHWQIEHPRPYSIICLRDGHRKSHPEFGCAFWVRATGCDDEESIKVKGQK